MSIPWMAAPSVNLPVRVWITCFINGLQINVSDSLFHVSIQPLKWIGEGGVRNFMKQSHILTCRKGHFHLKANLYTKAMVIIPNCVVAMIIQHVYHSHLCIKASIFMSLGTTSKLHVPSPFILKCDRYNLDIYTIINSPINAFLIINRYFLFFVCIIKIKKSGECTSMEYLN